MKSVSCVSVRLEGSVNCDWKVTYMDGTKEEFYAYEESPKRSFTDETVWNTDQILSDFLSEQCVELGNAIGGWNPDDNDCIEYKIDFITRTITDITIFICDDDGEYTEKVRTNTYGF